MYNHISSRVVLLFFTPDLKIILDCLLFRYLMFHKFFLSCMARDMYFTTFWLLYCGISDLILKSFFSVYQV